MTRLPDCAGRTCEYIELTPSEITAKVYLYTDPKSGETIKETKLSDDVKTAFREAVEKLYRSSGKGCGCGCNCERTGTKLRGPTIPSAPEKYTHVFAGGGKVEGTFKVSMTVFEGLCVPDRTGSGADSCCDRHEPPRHAGWWDECGYYYHRGYRYPAYWPYWRWPRWY